MTNISAIEGKKSWVLGFGLSFGKTFFFLGFPTTPFYGFSFEFGCLESAIDWTFCFC